MKAGLPKAAALILDLGGVIASVALLAMVLALVLTRYVLGWSVVGLHELALLAAIWLYMLGGVIASRRREHLVVDFLPQRLTDPRAKAWHGLLVSAISLVIICLFAFWAWRMMGWAMQRPQTTSALDISLLIPQAAIMFGAIGCLIYALRDLALSIAAVREAGR